MKHHLKISRKRCTAAQQALLLSSMALRRTSDQADVKLVCGVKEFHCHKLVLQASTPYFEAMFSGAFKEATAGKVVFDIKDVDCETLETIIQFIYLGALPPAERLPQSKLKKLLAASRMMQLNHLTDICIVHLACEVSVGNAYELWKLAIIYDSWRVKTEVVNCLSSTTPLLVDRHFLSLEMTDVKELALCLKDKLTFLNDLLKWLLAWLTHDLAEREKFTAELLKCITSKTLSKDFVLSLVQNGDIMNSSKEIENELNKLVVEGFFFAPETKEMNQEVVMKYRGSYSKACQLLKYQLPLTGGFQWHLLVESRRAVKRKRSKPGSTSIPRSLGVYLSCSPANSQSNADWTASATVRVKLLGGSTRFVPVTKEFSHVFSPGIPTFGWDQFISFKDVGQYMREKNLHFEVHLKSDSSV